MALPTVRNKFIQSIIKLRPTMRYSSNTTYSKPETKTRIFSGIQPTGNLHLGNYFGAITQWKKKQEGAIYSIVDLHSITLPQNPSELRENIFGMTATLLACGIDPNKAILCQQSQVPHHCDLSWVLGCLTTLPRLTHLPQYKEKSALLKEVPLGLFVYPVLQVADILLYRASEVPVGDDQLQHIQLAQHLAKVFNNRYGKIFPQPQPIVVDDLTSRLRSLRQPDKKMSKSEPNPKSRIELIDTKDSIHEKVRKAVTDMNSEITFDMEKRPGVSNLILIHSLCSGMTSDEIVRTHKSVNTGEYKLIVAESVDNMVAPIRKSIEHLLQDKVYLTKVLHEGSLKAAEVAETTWKEVKGLVGLL